MTDLLDLAVAAHGGLNRFNQFKTVSAHLVIGGRIWPLKGQDGVLIPTPLLCDRIKENTRKHMWRGMNIINGTSNHTSGRPSVSG
jgi:hypothetical protein